MTEASFRLKTIEERSITDTHLSSLLRSARESAEIYLLVAKRQKGCDGMGEVAMIKEEFGEELERLIFYCKEKELISNDYHYDPETMASELIRYGQKDYT